MVTEGLELQPATLTVEGVYNMHFHGHYALHALLAFPAFESIWAPTWENWIFAYAKTKTQISFALTAKLISAFVFATWIVQSICFLYPKFQVSSHLLWLYSPVCVGPGRKPRRPVFCLRKHFISYWGTKLPSSVWVGSYMCITLFIQTFFFFFFSSIEYFKKLKMLIYIIKEGLRKLKLTAKSSHFIKGFKSSHATYCLK